MRCSSSSREQQFLMARAGALDVDRREDAAVGQRAVEHQFLVAGGLELFEDHVVHAAAGLHQGGGDHGQAAAFLDVAGRGEEPLRAVERARVETAGEGAAARRDGQVGGPGETGERVEQHHHVASRLHQPLRVLQHDLLQLQVVLRQFVEGGGDDLAIHRAPDVGHFLRALVDQQHEQVHLGVVLRDAVGDLLEQRRLAGLRRGDDQTALALADRGDDVDEAPGDVARRRSPCAASRRGRSGSVHRRACGSGRSPARRR